MSRNRTRGVVRRCARSLLNGIFKEAWYCTDCKHEVAAYELDLESGLDGAIFHRACDFEAVRAWSVCVPFCRLRIFIYPDMHSG